MIKDVMDDAETRMGKAMDALRRDLTASAPAAPRHPWSIAFTSSITAAPRRSTSSPAYPCLSPACS